MIKVLNSSDNGRVFRCSSCNKIHIEFKNLNFNFNDKEFKSFFDYLISLDGLHWENKNRNIQYKRKILIPTNQNNMNILLNKDELNELRRLFILPVFKNLEFCRIKYDICNN